MIHGKVGAIYGKVWYDLWKGMVQYMERYGMIQEKDGTMHVKIWYDSWKGMVRFMERYGTIHGRKRYNIHGRELWNPGAVI